MYRLHRRRRRRHIIVIIIIIIIIIITLNVYNMLEHIPLKLQVFLIFPSTVRSSYASSSLGLLLDSQFWWSIRVHLFQVI